jgi:hypothetical protein
MPLTLPELYNLLINIDEISLLEVLEISSEDIVERFKDKIDEQADTLEKEFEERIDE